jgi:hypothetical protein
MRMSIERRRPIYIFRSETLSFSNIRLIALPESSDMQLHLAGVNEYRGCASLRWKACGNSYQFDRPRGSQTEYP